MKITKLYDKNGKLIKNPSSIDGSISWQSKSGEAYAFGVDGKKLIAELQNAMVIWIEVNGLRIRGAEPVDINATKFILQEWHVSF